MSGAKTIHLLTREDSAILLNVKIMILGEHQRYRRKGQIQHGPTEGNPQREEEDYGLLIRSELAKLLQMDLEYGTSLRSGLLLRPVLRRMEITAVRQYTSGIRTYRSRVNLCDISSVPYIDCRA